MVPSQIHCGIEIVWGVKGGPKCPNTVAKGAGVMDWLKDRGWEPSPMKEAQRQCWLKLQGWIEQGAGGLGIGYAARERYERAVRSLKHPDSGTGIREQVRGEGAAVYRMMWRMDNEASFRRWVIQKPLQRRWMPAEGQE